MMQPFVRSTVLAGISGFLTRPCCVVPAAMSLAGVGTATASSIVFAHRPIFLAASALLLAASGWVSLRREGGWVNKWLAAGASLIAFCVAAGWIGAR